MSGLSLKDSDHLVLVEPRHEYFLKEAQFLLRADVLGNHSDIISDTAPLKWHLLARILFDVD